MRYAALSLLPTAPPSAAPSSFFVEGEPPRPPARQTNCCLSFSFLRVNKLCALSTAPHKRTPRRSPLVAASVAVVTPAHLAPHQSFAPSIQGPNKTSLSSCMLTLLPSNPLSFTCILFPHFPQTRLSAARTAPLLRGGGALFRATAAFVAPHPFSQEVTIAPSPSLLGMHMCVHSSEALQAYTHARARVNTR